jgi:TatD DNase family protein
MHLFDTHVHLFEPPLAGDLDGVLARAHAAGVTRLLVPGVDVATSRTALALQAAHPGVLAAVGVHPDVVDARGWSDGTLDELEALILAGGVVAVGEIGMDSTGEGRRQEEQEAAFRAQLALARRHGLPALVHCRGVFGRVLELLSELGPRPRAGLLHAFNGSLEAARACLSLGYSLGVAGVITRPEATRARALVAALPLDALVLETDAPFIGTAAHPRGTVEPAHLAETCAALAALHHLPPELIAARTTANALALLGPSAVQGGAFA